MAAAVALVQLQDRHQPLERFLRRPLRFGERRGHCRTAVAKPILQGVVQPILRDRGVVPVATERERFTQPGLVEWLQQVVHDLIAQAGHCCFDVARRRSHDDRRIRERSRMREASHTPLRPGMLTSHSAIPGASTGRLAAPLPRCRLPAPETERIDPGFHAFAMCAVFIDNQYARPMVLIILHDRSECRDCKSSDQSRINATVESFSAVCQLQMTTVISCR